jgi:hypothetical protein
MREGKMAGDWIKLRHDLPEDPAVISIAAALGIEEDCVVGKLHRFWSWADRQTVDGNATSVTVAWLDRYVGVAGFAQALVEVGWLTTTSEGLRVPKFEKHISESAKRRALGARRAAKCRNGPGVTKSAPREEKRREEKKEEPPKSPFDEIDFPDGTDTPKVRQAVADWLAYHRKLGKPYKDPARQMTLLLKKYPSEAEFCAAVEHSIAQNYQGCYPPGGTHGRTGTPQAGGRAPSPGQKHDPERPVKAW